MANTTAIADPPDPPRYNGFTYSGGWSSSAPMSMSNMIVTWVALGATRRGDRRHEHASQVLRHDGPPRAVRSPRRLAPLRWPAPITTRTERHLMTSPLPEPPRFVLRLDQFAENFTRWAAQLNEYVLAVDAAVRANPSVGLSKVTALCFQQDHNGRILELERRVEKLERCVSGPIYLTNSP